MINPHDRIEITVRQPLRLILPVIVFTAIITTVPTSISASGSANPYDLLIVANRSSKTDSLTVVRVRDYFLKKRYSYSGGEKVVPINAKEKTLRNAFRKRVLEMSAEEEQRYWQYRMVRSAVDAPPEFGNTLKAAFKLKGGLSYVFRKDYRENVVKIVLEIPAG